MSIGPAGHDAAVLQAINQLRADIIASENNLRADLIASFRADLIASEERASIRNFNAGALTAESEIRPLPLIGGEFPADFPLTILELRSLSHERCTYFLQEYNLPALHHEVLRGRIRSLAYHIGARE